LAPKITKLCFGFEIIWRQNIGKKNKCKLLMKLTSANKFVEWRTNLPNSYDAQIWQLGSNSSTLYAHIFVDIFAPKITTLKRI